MYIWNCSSGVIKLISRYTNGCSNRTGLGAYNADWNELQDFADITNMDRGAVELLQQRTKDSRFNTRMAGVYLR